MYTAGKPADLPGSHPPALPLLKSLSAPFPAPVAAYTSRGTLCTFCMLWPGALNLDLRAACGQGPTPPRAWSAASSASLAPWSTPLYSLAPAMPASSTAVLPTTLPLCLPAACAAPAAAHVASLLGSMPASCAAAVLPAMQPLSQPAACSAALPACLALAAASAALPPPYMGSLSSAITCFAPLPRLALPLPLYPKPSFPVGCQFTTGMAPSGLPAASPGGNPGKLYLAAAAARAVAAANAAGLQAPEAGPFNPAGSPKTGSYPAREADCGRAWSDTLLCSPVGALPPVLPAPTVTF